MNRIESLNNPYEDIKANPGDASREQNFEELRVNVSSPGFQWERDTETYLYVEAANGMLVHIPASQLEEWSKGQQEIRNRTHKPDEQLIEEIVSHFYGQKE